MTNYYKVLGIDADASPEDIKTAYRKLAHTHHPDKGGCEEKFKEINEAYATLSSPANRTEYDNARTMRQPNMNSWEDVFGDFFRNVAKRKAARGPTNDADVRFNLGVNLEQIKRGATQVIRYKRNSICKPCSGKGGTSPDRCKICGGAGMVSRYNRHGTVVRTACGHCQTRGITFEKLCGSCVGEGMIVSVESITIKVSEE